MSNQYDFIDAGIRVFGLNGAKDNLCNCGNPDCQALFKHPVASNWQHTPEWSDEQLETMEEMGHFKTGYGVLVQGLLVVDVDARNGGVESFNKLCKDLDIDLLGESGLAVATGSGAGSMHLYFKIEKGAYLQHLEIYPGIDMKTSGFVVGPESLHKSGNTYEVIHGTPDDIEEAAASLVALLVKPEHHRAEFNGAMVDVNDAEIIDMLTHIDFDTDHETWYRVGMAIHHITNGSGFAMWDDWSSKGAKYPSSSILEKRWHSFGKSSNPVTFGTLVHYAEAAGWQMKGSEVTFMSDLEDEQGDEIDISGVDYNRPPGFVGELTQWINNQCLYPRESLAVAAALSVMGNICGLRYIDEQDGMTTNLFSFCVAGSSTGKEAVQQAWLKIMKEAMISGAVHGAFKSEQEVIRNLIRHQMAAYSVDELGITLKKVKNAQAKGGASYLEGLIGILMSAYSKGTGMMPISGDTRDEVSKAFQNELAQCNKKIDENEDKTGFYARKKVRLERALGNIEQGLEAPFLSIIGFTTPVTFNSLVDFEQATNGFLSRALISNDLETNPKRKPGFKKQEMPDSIKYTLQTIYNGGEYAGDIERIEYYGEKIKISSTADASAMLDQVYAYFWETAEQHKGKTGLEAIPRRGYELCGKISTILAAPEGLRTKEHVRWAFAIVRRDVDYKLKLAYANMKEDDNQGGDAVLAKIMNCLRKDHGETEAVIINRCRPHAKKLVQEMIQKLVDSNQVRKNEDKHKGNGRAIVKYYEA
jgi:hypothetical protein